jgi:hypothetical protein
MSAPRLKHLVQQQRQIEFSKRTTKVVPIGEGQVDFAKTAMMKYLEEVYGQRIKSIIKDGTIYEVAARIQKDKGIHVAASTIYKWRTKIKAANFQPDNLPVFHPTQEETKQLLVNRPLESTPVEAVYLDG